MGLNLTRSLRVNPDERYETLTGNALRPSLGDEIVLRNRGNDTTIVDDDPIVT
jgi:hypothetical protein